MEGDVGADLVDVRAYPAPLRDQVDLLERTHGAADEGGALVVRHDEEMVGPAGAVEPREGRADVIEDVAQEDMPSGREPVPACT